MVIHLAVESQSRRCCGYSSMMATLIRDLMQARQGCVKPHQPQAAERGTYSSRHVGRSYW